MSTTEIVAAISGSTATALTVGAAVLVAIASIFVIKLVKRVM
jgi:hypothetical protein